MQTWRFPKIVIGVPPVIINLARSPLRDSLAFRGSGPGMAGGFFLAGPSRSPKAMVDVGHLMMFTFFWDHEMGVCLRGMGWDCLILL